LKSGDFTGKKLIFDVSRQKSKKQAQLAYHCSDLKEDGQIRLLKVEPGLDNAPIYASIVHISLSEASSIGYEIVSYV
jgi:hypothetical protein